MTLSNNKYFIYSFKDGTSSCLEKFLMNKNELSIVLVNFDEFIIKNNDSNSFLATEEVFDYCGNLYFIHKNMNQLLLINYELMYKEKFFLVKFGLVGFRTFFINKNFLLFVEYAFFFIVKYLKNFFILLFLLFFIFFNDSVVKEDFIQAENYNLSQKKLYQGFEFFAKNNNIKEYEIFNNNKSINNIVDKKLNKNTNYKINKKFIDEDELYFLRMKIKNEFKKN